MAYRLSSLHFRLARPGGIATIVRTIRPGEAQGDDAAAKIVGDHDQFLAADSLVSSASTRLIRRVVGNHRPLAGAGRVRELRRSPLNLNLLVEALEVLGRDIRFRLSIRAAMTIVRRADRERVLDDVFRALLMVAVCIPAVAARTPARILNALTFPAFAR
jgi:translation initiation factor 2 gamma subunit (eIF-2gamma)